MEVVKAFNNNDIGMNITIRGTYEKPLFRATDVGAVLEIAKIRNTISDFDETRKVAHKIGTLGGEQEVTFLTTKGLYEILFRSRKPIAKKFKDWACDVIDEIRLTGQYKLEKEVEELKQQIEETTGELEIKISENEQRVVDYFEKIVYAGYADESKRFVKFGYTNCIKKRLKKHKKTFGSQFTFEIVIPSVYNIEIEKMIKNIEPLKKRIIKTDTKETEDGKSMKGKLFGDDLVTEIIKLDEKFTMNDLRIVLKGFKETAETDLEEENKHLKYRLLEMEKKFEKFENGQIIDLQLNSMQNLDANLWEIKKAVCYNFLIDLIVKEIIKRNGEIEFTLKFTLDELFKKCIQFRESNRFHSPVYCEKYEKSIITKSFENVPGIEHYRGSKGVSRKIFNVLEISKWICKEVNVPKRFRMLFRKISENVKPDIEKYEITNISDPILIHIYKFLIHILFKYKKDSSKILIKKTIITEEYLNFIFKNKYKKQTMTSVYDILCKISGIKIRQVKLLADKNVKNPRTLCIEVANVSEWIGSNLEIPDELKHKLVLA